MFKRNFKSNGYLILEVLIAIVIFSMVLLTLYTMVRTSQLRTTRSDYDSQASLLLQEGMEIAVGVVKSDWDAYLDGTYHPVYDADNDSWVLVTGSESGLQTRFERAISLSRVCRDSTSGEIIEESAGLCSGDIDPNSKLLKTVVSWDEKGEAKDIEAQLLVLNLNKESD
jgi:hypothetical protein